MRSAPDGFRPPKKTPGVHVVFYAAVVSRTSSLLTYPGNKLRMTRSSWTGLYGFVT